MQKNNNKIYKLILLIRSLSIIVIVISAIYIIKWFLDNKSSEDLMDNILSDNTISEEEIILNDQDKVEIVKPDFQKLTSINQDVIGWIKVNGTNINYPVVQTTDNEYYLTHSFDRSYNKSGWIFADCNNNALKEGKLNKNTVIYGHNRQNNSMFGTLSNTLNKQWRDEIRNRYISFSTLKKDIIWEVFSTYTIDSEDYYIQTQFGSEKDYINFLNNLKNRSTYKFDVDLSKDDNILTLSTCTNIGEGRTVVHAKLLK